MFLLWRRSVVIGPYRSSNVNLIDLRKAQLPNGEERNINQCYGNYN